MGKRGGTKHIKRIAASKAIPLNDKKLNAHLLRAHPGPHNGDSSMALGVLLRDVLRVVKTSKEAKDILNARAVTVDGTVRTEIKFPVGLMDTVGIAHTGAHYRISVDHKGRLTPVEISKADSEKKVCKVIGKKTLPKGKISIALHDGKNMILDNHIHVGDSLLVSVPANKLEQHLKLNKGSRCLIQEGKHAGHIATLKEIVTRKEGKAPEAIMSDGKEDFITVAKYLFVINDSYKGVSQ